MAVLQGHVLANTALYLVEICTFVGNKLIARTRSILVSRHMLLT